MDLYVQNDLQPEGTMNESTQNQLIMFPPATVFPIRRMAFSVGTTV